MILHLSFLFFNGQASSERYCIFMFLFFLRDNTLMIGSERRLEMFSRILQYLRFSRPCLDQKGNSCNDSSSYNSAN